MPRSQGILPSVFQSRETVRMYRYTGEVRDRSVKGTAENRLPEHKGGDVEPVKEPIGDSPLSYMVCISDLLWCNKHPQHFAVWTDENIWS